jgi:hypothetical protein
VIATEVQRTLVKSPPELWTELSDPDALARHLGELGEIRITRTEPERLVAWEAAGTTGTVAIKASGWGTKVTLTVNRELRAGGEPRPEDEPAVPGPEGGAERTTPTEPSAQGEQDLLDEAGSETAAVSSDEATGETIALEHTPAPATEAARRAAGWPGPAADAGPAIESDLRAAEAAPGGEAVVLPEDTPDTFVASATAQETQADPDDVEPEPSPAPRRGLFARLFGRRRRPDAAFGPPPAESSDAAPAFIAEEPVADLAEEAVAELGEEPVAELAEEPIAELAEEPIAELAEEPIAELAEEPVAELAEEHAAAPESEPLASAEPSVPPEAAADVQAEAAEQPPAREDLAAELKAAEETAADEVTAVLTAVLDRLGAAHHRPFSRA